MVISRYHASAERAVVLELTESNSRVSFRSIKGNFIRRSFMGDRRMPSGGSCGALVLARRARGAGGSMSSTPVALRGDRFRPQSIRGRVTVLVTVIAILLLVPAAVAGSMVASSAISDSIWQHTRRQAALT